MHFILVFDRCGGELYSYDTRSGEQTLMGVCKPPTSIMPSRMADLQRDAAIRFSLELMGLFVVAPPDPIVVAAQRDLPERFVRTVVEHFGVEVRRQCQVDAGGQMGLNQVVREQLTLDDDCSCPTAVYAPPPPPSTATWEPLRLPRRESSHRC